MGLGLCFVVSNCSDSTSKQGLQARIYRGLEALLVWSLTTQIRLLCKDFKQSCHWGRFQGSSGGEGKGRVSGLLLYMLSASYATSSLFCSAWCTAIQTAGLIPLPCATPSRGAGAGAVGGGVSGVVVGVVEFLSVIDSRVLRFLCSLVPFALMTGVASCCFC